MEVSSSLLFPVLLSFSPPPICLCLLNQFPSCDPPLPAVAAAPDPLSPLRGTEEATGFFS
jgi:hypothetical protein